MGEGNEKLLVDVHMKIWEWAEVGLQEFKSGKLVADTLEEEGFKVERGVAGMPSAFVARAHAYQIRASYSRIPLVVVQKRISYMYLY